MGGCRCSSGKAPRARSVACAGNGIGCVAGEARAGAVVGCAAAVADERSDVGSNRAATASTGDSVLVGRIHPFEGRLPGPPRRGCDHDPENAVFGVLRD